MSYATEDAPTTVCNPTRSSGSDNNCPRDENMPPAEEVAHYPLGSWERHLLEERLRAFKRYERERLSQEALQKECTFHPRVGTSRGKTLELQEMVTGSVGRKGRQMSVFERLAQRAKEREARLALVAEEKKRREEEALREAFHPCVNFAVEHQVPFASNNTHVPVEERLLHYGRSIEQSRRLLQQQQEQKELEEIRQKSVSSRRASNNVSGEKHQNDIADRSKKLLIEREMQRAVAKQALLNQHTFRPKVCTTSNVIDRHLKRKKNIRDRGVALYNEGMRRQQERQTEVVKRQEKESSGLHKPTTNSLSEDWIHHGQHRALFGEDFVRRQEIYQRVKEEHQRNLASALEKSERVNVPRVNQEMIEKQVERLYLEAQEIQKESKKRMENHITAHECPFRPQLAPGTEYVIARTQREEDVVKRLAAGHRRRQAPTHPSIFDTAYADEEEGEDRTRKSKVVHPDEAAEFYYRQKKAVEEREVQLREQKQRQAMEELCACTFRPRTCTDAYLQRRQKQATSNEAQKPVEARVSGVVGYLQRQAEAKRRLKEQEARYNNLGRGLPCNGVNSTVITPFNLSSGRRPRPQSLSPRCNELKADNTEDVDSHHYHRHLDPYDNNKILLALRGNLYESPARSHMRQEE